MESSFYQTWIERTEPELALLTERIGQAGPEDVLRALERIPVTLDGFLALLSPSAGAVMAQVEQSARKLTEQRFGRVVNLYIPLYLSNACVNDCAYCWFGRSNPAPRRALSLAETEAEARRLLQEGYRSLLLVSGEDPAGAPLKHLAECVKMAKRIGFAFVGLEARALSTAEYRVLAEAGLDSVTVYQETYDPAIYASVHKSGPKKNFRERMETPDRAAMAGVRNVGMGVLLGLGEMRKDALALASHIKHMQKRHWRTAVAVSFPRIHAAPGGFSAPHPVSDQELVRLIAAMRLAFPDSTLTLSTREAPQLRDKLFGMGINQASAGSKTSPGAYTLGGGEEQFPVVDGRPPAQVMEAIRGRGLEWVMKDWDVNLRPAPTPEEERRPWEKSHTGNPAGGTK